jgi:hypothetical protein
MCYFFRVFVPHWHAPHHMMYWSGWLLAGWILSSALRDYLNWIIWHCYAVFSFGIIYVPMYSTCLLWYLHAYVPMMYNSLLY